ncbi:MAG: hypothetical protein AMXMBFR53_33860 [Gemmatimonadota bacterium]
MRPVVPLTLALVLSAACGPRGGGPASEGPAPTPAADAHAGHVMPAPAEEADTTAMRPGMGRMGMGMGMGMRMGMRGGMGQDTAMAHPMGGRGMGMGMGRMRMEEPPEPTDSVLLEGKQTFDQVCAACHTLEPPPNLAPPMRMVSMHLRQAFPGEEEAVAHVLAYLPAPDTAKAVMPAHAIERFGLMLAQPLPPETLEKVARYVWSLSEGMQGMEGMEGMRGRGMGGGRMMQGGQGGGMQVRMRQRGGR